MLTWLPFLAYSFSKVANLSENSFDKLVGKDSHYFVKFYVPWCGVCADMAPAYEKLSEVVAENYKDIIISEVDCEQNSDLDERFVPEGYPTLKWFPKNGGSIHGHEYNTDMGLEVKNMLSFIEKIAVIGAPASGKSEGDL